MKKSLSVFAGLLFLVGSGQAVGAYTVDVGGSGFSSISYGWGPIVTTAGPGNWGGFGDGTLQVVWSPSETGVNLNWAAVRLDFGTAPGANLQMSHLDGLADDGFNLYLTTWTGTAPDFSAVPGSEALIGSYTTQWTNGPEIWVTTDYYAAGSDLKLLWIEATGAQWNGWTTYGQLAFDSMDVDPVPLPSALWLLGAGFMGLVGLGRRASIGR
ncbi:MAG: VPLPA-CTERM sorting domain-containing protein [Thermodesulfobacteriota bacterium]|nr:VPLPA-CTERM sorting domain-containing protein [Thermodesulfobacteriota bacterium]